MKNWLIGIIILMFCVQGVMAANYYVYNWIDLQNIEPSHLSDDVYLMNDLDLITPGYALYQTGAGFNPIGTFTGTFDGQNHTITGLYINRPQIWVGLFAFAYGATIKNVGLEDVNIAGSGDVGGLAGYAAVASIENSYAIGDVTGEYNVGGLVGRSYLNNVISNSYASVNVTGLGWSIGGLVGYSLYSINSNSYATGDVTGNKQVGGLVGRNEDSDIDNSYSTGKVIGAREVGGLVGYNYYSDVGNSYATGSVIGSTNVGGLVGYSLEVNISNSYWNNYTENPDVGIGSGTDTSTPIQDNEAYFYSGSNPPMSSWDTNVWTFSGTGFPDLSWEGPSCTGTDDDNDKYTTSADDVGQQCCVGLTEICLEVDNCPANYNPDQLDSDSQNGGDVCDICPADTTDNCESSEDYTEGESINETGGTITNDAGEAIIDIPAGTFDDDTSVSMSRGNSNFKLEYADRRSATVLYEYDIIAGQETFNQPVTLTFNWGTGLSDIQEQNVHLYYYQEGVGWEKILPETKDYGANTITVGVSHFSKFAILIPDPDGLIGDAEEEISTLTGAEDKDQKEIEKALKELKKSLGNLSEEGDKRIKWINGTTIEHKHGKKVFDHLEKAVKHLKKVKDPSIIDDIERIIGYIISADKVLAETAIDKVYDGDIYDPAFDEHACKDNCKDGEDACKGACGEDKDCKKDSKDEKKTCEDACKAMKEFQKGEAELKIDKKIDYYKKAWEKVSKKGEGHITGSIVAALRGGEAVNSIIVLIIVALGILVFVRLKK